MQKDVGSVSSGVPGLAVRDLRIFTAVPPLYAELYALTSTHRPSCCERLYSQAVFRCHTEVIFATERHEWEIDFDIFVYLRDNLTNWFSGFISYQHTHNMPTENNHRVAITERSMLFWKSQESFQTVLISFSLTCTSLVFTKSGGAYEEMSSGPITVFAVHVKYSRINEWCNGVQHRVRCSSEEHKPDIQYTRGTE